MVFLVSVKLSQIQAEADLKCVTIQSWYLQASYPKIKPSSTGFMVPEEIRNMFSRYCLANTSFDCFGVVGVFFSRNDS